MGSRMKVNPTAVPWIASIRYLGMASQGGGVGWRMAEELSFIFVY